MSVSRLGSRVSRVVAVAVVLVVTRHTPAQHAAPASEAGLNAAETRALVTALRHGGLYWADLGFKKDVAAAVAKPPVVLRALDQPLDFLAELGEAAESTAAGEILRSAGLFEDLTRAVPDVRRPVEDPFQWHPEVKNGAQRLGITLEDWRRVADQPFARNAVVAVGEAVLEAEGLLERALAPLSNAERALVRTWGLRHVLAPDEAFDRFEPEPGAIDAGADPARDVLAAIAKVDRWALAAAADVMVRRLRHAHFSKVPVPPDAGFLDPSRMVQGKILARVSTRFGDLVVGGPGDNVYTGIAPAFIVEPGGNDTYEAAGIGGVAGESDRPFAIVVDCAGDDIYTSDAPFSLGGARLGIAVLWDQQGDDRYTGTLVTQGAAIAGVGILQDDGGRDRFTAVRHAQGAGLGGVGVLISGSSDGATADGPDDHYRIVTFGQGFARTNGVGLLLDHDGHDTYEGGGEYPYLPQAPEHTYSHCQGYAIGVREYGYAGGVGLLIDRAGNDTYRASMQAQGAACFYALGALIDLAGDDTYEAVFNAQGAAVHEAAGFLIDGGGSDRYTLASKHARNGLGQGAAHDFAVGLLHDRGGNDHYRARAAAQGVGLTTALGVLIDRDGDDRYEGATGHLQGAGRRNRQLPSLGVLVDAGGHDTYSTDRADGTVWVTSDLGVGIDVGSGGDAEPRAATGDGSGDRPLAPSPRPPKPGDAVLEPAEFARLFAAASQWDVGEARQAVRSARDELIAWGPRVLAHLWAEIGGAWTGPRLWAIDDVLSGVARAHGPAVREFLQQAIDARHPQLLVTAAMVGAHLGYDEARPAALQLLAEPWSRRYGAAAAGLLRLGEAVPDVAVVAASTDETEAALAVQALGRIGVVDTGAHLLAGIDHRSFLVRDAAARAFAEADDDALAALLKRAQDPKADPVTRVWTLSAIAWCRRSAVAEQAGAIAALLGDADASVRAATAEALGGAAASPVATQALRERIAVEPDPGVRRRIREALQQLAGERPRRQEMTLHSGVVEYPDFFGGG